MLTRTFNAKEYTLRLKATIQATGKLGFTAETIKTLGLTPECSILLGPDDENEEIYYMGVLREKREDAFAVMSSGVYLYLNTKQLFDDMGIDYSERWTVMFDLSRFKEGDELMGCECYKMQMRKNPRTTEDKN